MLGSLLTHKCQKLAYARFIAYLLAQDITECLLGSLFVDGGLVKHFMSLFSQGTFYKKDL